MLPLPKEESEVVHRALSTVLRALAYSAKLAFARKDEDP